MGTVLQEMDNPALPPSDLQTVRPLHLTLVSLATCLLPSVVLPLCQHYWAFLLSFGAVGFLTGQDLSVYIHIYINLYLIYCCRQDWWWAAPTRCWWT